MHQVLLQGCLDLPTGILHNRQVSNHIILFPHVSYAFQDQIACPSQAFDLNLMIVAFSFYDRLMVGRVGWLSWVELVTCGACNASIHQIAGVLAKKIVGRVK